MYIKRRTKSIQLLIMEALRGRIIFSRQQEQIYWRLLKGYLGECSFDELTALLDENVMIINDLYLSTDLAAQIDAIIVTERIVYLFEVKNFAGPLYYRDGIFHTDKKAMANDPLDRIKRAKLELENILRKQGLDITVVARVVFINPDMMLYGNDPSLPILMYPQIQPFLEGIRVYDRDYAKRIAEFIVRHHSDKNPYQQVMEYDDTVQKGIHCAKCFSLRVNVQHSKIHCIDCGQAEYKKDVVLRHLHEFHLLFPEKKLTPTAIHDWCGKEISRMTIHRIVQDYKKCKVL